MTVDGVPLRWSDSGPADQRNAFGEVVSADRTTPDDPVFPIICMHGGSKWLCHSCAETILKANDGKSRAAKPVEYAWIKSGRHKGPEPVPRPSIIGRCLDVLSGHKWREGKLYHHNGAWCIDYRCSRCGTVHTAWSREGFPEIPGFVRQR
jgi:hypothetical protein